MRPPLWTPPVELSASEEVIIKRIIYSQTIYISQAQSSRYI
ncbi:hypothetical protein E5S67_06073 [Microcoleus sp. IPMA8]|uniref:Uncharacterized protein n=1 Tax=Microcoleus asticus IPMA8 TaxID=2563858 RepID=A0ABX2D6V4_9CYAN|nr:hypothetical protein [Microcoleus asticus IPMA8]